MFCWGVSSVKSASAKRREWEQPEVPLVRYQFSSDIKGRMRSAHINASPDCISLCFDTRHYVEAGRSITPPTICPLQTSFLHHFLRLDQTFPCAAPSYLILGKPLGYVPVERIKIRATAKGLRNAHGSATFIPFHSCPPSESSTYLLPQHRSLISLGA